MDRRTFLTVGMIVVGLALMIVTYFFWAAPWGFPPSSEEYSNPRVEFAPAWFVLGVVMVFMAAVLYEVLPDKERADG